jgi:hypothetical protein
MIGVHVTRPVEKVREGKLGSLGATGEEPLGNDGGKYRSPVFQGGRN